jgi:hypothetical protein
VNEPRNARQRFDVLLAPDSHVLWGDPPLGADGRRLHHNKSHSAGSAAAQMDKVPVVGQPVVGTVLAHGRHDDPIAKRDAPNGEWAQQIEFWNFPVMLGAGRTPVVCPDWILSGCCGLVSAVGVARIRSLHESAPAMIGHSHRDDTSDSRVPSQRKTVDINRGSGRSSQGIQT